MNEGRGNCHNPLDGNHHTAVTFDTDKLTLNAHDFELGALLDRTISMVQDAAQAKGLHAGKLVGAIAKVAGGGGGGKPDKAQAGGKNPDKLPDALATARELITQALT